MNPWLFRWHPMNPRIAKTIPNLIAAILPNRTGPAEVKKIMLLLHANYSARPGLSENVYLSEQVRFAKRDFPYKVMNWFFPVYSCGGDPILIAQQVFDLQVFNHESGETLQWEENVYPKIRDGDDPSEVLDAALSFKRKRLTYTTATNTIVISEPPPKKKRSRQTD
jgi:hypothetical protein